LGLRGRSELLHFRVGSEKLFINNEEFISNYLKRYTAPVREDILPPQSFKNLKMKLASKEARSWNFGKN